LFKIGGEPDKKTTIGNDKTINIILFKANILDTLFAFDLLLRRVRLSVNSVAALLEYRLFFAVFATVNEDKSKYSDV
jgi:hypothetical protein